jgi:hypothetical protein
MLKKSEPSQFSNLYTAVNPKPRDIYDVRVFGCKYVFCTRFHPDGVHSGGNSESLRLSESEVIVRN